MRHMIRFTVSVLLIAAAAQLPAAEKFDAAARAKAVAPFIDEQTVAVARADVSRLDVGAAVDWVSQHFPEAAEEAKPAKHEIGSLREAFLKAGGKEVYGVVSLTDLPQHPFFAVVPLAKGADEKALTALFQQMHKAERLGDVLVVGHGSTLQRLKGLKPDERPELAKAFEAAGDTAAQVLVLPPKHTGRVIEETIPTLPKEIGGGSSKVLTQGVLWAAVGLNPPPQLSLRLVVQSKDQHAAGALREKLLEAARLVGQLKEVHRLVPKFNELAKALMPQAEGDRLVVTLDDRSEAVSSLLGTIRTLVDQERAEAMRHQSANNLRQIAMAMAGYEGEHNTLPPPAIYDAQGKPLLSWRVAILPYVDGEKLYKQFHLNEPWDSEHNRKLLGQMPTVYRSPGSKLKEKDRSLYLAPVGKETAFPGREGISQKDITDGTSDTIMVVEVSDEHAVPWTKPEDLPFDPDQPARGLGGPYPGGFWAAFCDGSARFVKLPQDPKDLRAMFTRAGREAVK